MPTPQLQVPGVAAWAPSFPWSPDALSQLLALCEPAPVGLGEHTVVDGAVRAGLQLKPEHFSLLNADAIAASIAAPIREALAPYLESAPVLELHKVQAYGVGGFFAAHRDTQRADDHFGTVAGPYTLPLVSVIASFGGIF